jgi:hypothetical protein
MIRTLLANALRNELIRSLPRQIFLLSKKDPSLAIQYQGSLTSALFQALAEVSGW